MKIPKYIRLIREKDFFRLRYRIGTTTVTSAGFRTKKEFLKVLKDDYYFKIPEQEEQK